MYEPLNLDDLTPLGAIDAVARDIDTHPVALTTSGILTVSRHVALIGHLVTRLAGDSHFYADYAREHHTHEDTASAWRSAEALSAAAARLTEALSHYTHALGPLAIISQPPHDTVPHKEVHQTEKLRSHLRDARRSLTQARTTLHHPAAPAPGVPRVPDPAPGPRR
ncbi:hypothetical protein [Streptomyces sp. NPDC088789]|uniref:hypothetical protein n=1 Tax=Streptomyces sp. NPDC088789 TaxID=3365899 RepID=UPI00381683C9